MAEAKKLPYVNVSVARVVAAASKHCKDHWFGAYLQGKKLGYARMGCRVRRWKGRKVLGCAQCRRREAVLVHGTLLTAFDPALQAAVYGVPLQRIEAAMAPLPLDPKAIEGLPRHLAEGFAAALSLGLTPAAPDRTLLARAEALRAARAADPRWTIV